MLALSGTEEFKHVDVDDFVFSLRSFQSGIERLIYAGCVSPAYTVLKARNAGDARYWAFLLKIDPYIAALQSVTREDSNLQPDRYERAAAGRSRKDDVRGYLPGSGAGGARGSSA
ncbi:MAG TPA: hypothetical protein VGL12_17480 [Roseiarcus sp.]